MPKHTNHPWRPLHYKEPVRTHAERIAEIRKWAEDPDKIPSEVRELSGEELEAVKRRLEQRGL